MAFLIFPRGQGSFWFRYGIKAVLIAAFVLASGFFFLACESDYSKAAPFSLGQAIPMGDGSMRVAYVEETAQFATSGSDKVLAVFLDSRDLYDLLQKQDPSAKDLKSWLALLSLVVKDREGKKYGPGIPMRERDFRLAQAGASGDVEAGWSVMTGRFEGGNVVVMFAVPQDSYGFTLYLKNPWPQDGQPQLAAVDLGR